MGKSILDLLETMFECGILAAALLLLSTQAWYVQKGQDVTAHYVETSEALSETYRWESAELTVTYSELCTRMMNGIPCDVKIDGQLVELQWYSRETFDYSMIRAGHIYRVDYEYDTDGSVKLIEYTSN